MKNKLLTEKKPYQKTHFFWTVILLATLSACSEIKTRHTSPADQVAKALNLSGHIEGGYYKRTYQADHRNFLETKNGERFLMTSIYYMLTSESPIGHWHLNKSDIMHYYHLGNPIEYNLIHPDGSLEKVIMGADVMAGQKLQLMVKGGIWKSSRLLNGSYDYGLISEAVSPGFDFADMTIGEEAYLQHQFPQHKKLIEQYSQ